MLENKVVVISGAGNGLGRELSKAFCACQCQVYGLGRTQATLQAVASECGERFHPKVVDVANFFHVDSVGKEILAETEGVDIVFNNAAVYPKHNFLDESADNFAAAIATNIVGVANLCKAVLPSMVAAKRGKIFNVGSWADLSPIAHSAAYACSKGALRALTKGIAADLAELALENPEIHEWIPGHLNTQMSGFTGMDPAIAAAWGVEIASRKASRQNLIFEQNREWQAPKSLKQRLIAKALFWR